MSQGRAKIEFEADASPVTDELVQKMSAAMDRIAEILEKGFAQAASRAESSVGGMSDSMDGATSAAENMGKAAEQAAADTATSASTAETSVEATERAFEAAAEAADEMGRSGERAARDSSTATDSTTSAVEATERAFEAAADAATGMGEAGEQAARDTSSAADNTQSSVNATERAFDAAAGAATDMGRAGQDAGTDAASGASTASSAFDDVGDAADQARTGIEDAGAEAMGLGDKIKMGLGAVSLGVLAGIGARIGSAVMGGIQDVFSSGFDLALDIDQASLVLGGLYSEADVAADTLERLGDISRESPIDHSTWISGAESLALAGVEGEQAIGILQNIGWSALGAGRDTEQSFDSVGNALGRMVGEGRVTAETINQIGDAGVFISTALAEHFGVAEDEMRTMLSEGVVGIEDVLAALHEMPGEAAQASVESGKEAENSLRNQLKELRGLIDTEIAEALTPVLEEMDFESIASDIASLVTSIAEILPILVDVGLWMADNSSWLLPLAGIIGGITAAMWLLNAALLANPFILIAGAVAAVAAGLIYFFTQTEHGQKVIDELWSVLKGVGAWIADVFTSIWDGVTAAWDAAWEWISGLIESIKGGWDSFKDSAIAVWDTVTDKIGDAVDFIKSIPGTIKDFFVDAGSWLVDAGKDIIGGLLEGLKNMGSTIGSFFLDLLPGWIQGPFKAALGIESPSTLFAGFGEDIGDGLIQGMEGMDSGVASAAQSMADSAAGIDVPAVGSPAVGGPDMGGLDVPMPPVDISADADADGGGGGLDGSAFAGAADEMAEAAGGVLDPMWQDQGEQVAGFGQTLTDTAQGVVEPAWGQMATNLDATKAGVLDPMMAGIDAGLANTGAQFQAQTAGVIQPAWQGMGTALDAVKTGTIDPAFDGIQTGLNNTGQAFAQGTAGMIAEWDKLREGTASPARFTINTVFSGVGGAWNEVAGMVGLDEIHVPRANFHTGAVLPGYTPGRDPYTFVEPNTGMSIGLSGGESIMRPEWTRAVGPAGVEAMNAAARSGGINAVRGLLAPHGGNQLQFADGGIFGGAHLGDFSEGAVIDSMTNFVNRFFPELSLTSGWRFTDSGYHSRGLAGDYSNQVRWGPPTPASMGLANAIYRNFAGQTAQLIHAPLQGWQNLLHGSPHNYGAQTDREHWDHVHWALERPLMAAGTDLDLSGGVGVVVDPREIVESMIGDELQSVADAAQGFRGMGGSIDGLPAAAHDTLIEPMLDALVEAFETFGGDPGGADVARWRPLAMQALSRHGYDPDQYIDAMMQQIQIESGGDPSALNLWDSNAAMGDPSGGLLQVIGGTYQRVRNAYPEAFAGLPDDRWHPLTNLTAGVGAVKMDWGGPAGRWPTTAGYDQGGLATDAGLLAKHIVEPERVLNPRQTEAFEAWLAAGADVDTIHSLIDSLSAVELQDPDLMASDVADRVQAWLDDSAGDGDLRDLLVTIQETGIEWERVAAGMHRSAEAWANGDWVRVGEDQRLATPDEMRRQVEGNFLSELADELGGMVGLSGLYPAPDIVGESGLVTLPKETADQLDDAVATPGTVPDVSVPDGADEVTRITTDQNTGAGAGAGDGEGGDQSINVTVNMEVNGGGDAQQVAGEVMTKLKRGLEQSIGGAVRSK